MMSVSAPERRITIPIDWLLDEYHHRSDVKFSCEWKVTEETLEYQGPQCDSGWSEWSTARCTVRYRGHRKQCSEVGANNRYKGAVRALLPRAVHGRVSSHPPRECQPSECDGVGRC